MNPVILKRLVRRIVKQATALKNKHTTETTAPVNYACIFSQSQQEFETLVTAANSLGSVIRETPTGPLFQIKPLETVAGELQLLKVRLPDPTRPERGDADFTVVNYQLFKKRYLQEPGFGLIVKPDIEMVELMDQDSAVRAYFSYPPLDVLLGLV